MKLDFSRATEAAEKLWRSRVGRVRTSTVVLVVVFIALSWVQQEYRPKQTAPSPDTQVVPPGFVPDPDYTWVPRTKLQTPRSTTPTETPETTETTVPETTTPTETTSPTETTTPGTPTSPSSTTPPPGAPHTTVFDPDGPGLLPPITLPLGPAPAPAPPTEQQQPGQEPMAPTLPR
ncbi:hypothetical protein [Mycobacterium sp. DL440]|uniref:hypothetical protein n=1 Tax=Mycobacterium sp. DL440 TaxID=2675523 RepID=UPI001422990E|nr:hypothetical protein [Mycobacterium sp. DL440]